MCSPVAHDIYKRVSSEKNFPQIPRALLTNLGDKFITLDRNHDGMLTLYEVTNLLEKFHIPHTYVEAKNLARSLGLTELDRVSYNDFLRMFYQGHINKLGDEQFACMSEERGGYLESRHDEFKLPAKRIDEKIARYKKAANNATNREVPSMGSSYVARRTNFQKKISFWESRLAAGDKHSVRDETEDAWQNITNGSAKLTVLDGESNLFYNPAAPDNPTRSPRSAVHCSMEVCMEESKLNVASATSDFKQTSAMLTALGIDTPSTADGATDEENVNSFSTFAELKEELTGTTASKTVYSAAIGGSCAALCVEEKPTAVLPADNNSDGEISLDAVMRAVNESTEYVPELSFQADADTFDKLFDGDISDMDVNKSYDTIVKELSIDLATAAAEFDDLLAFYFCPKTEVADFGKQLETDEVAREDEDLQKHMLTEAALHNSMPTHIDNQVKTEAVLNYGCEQQFPAPTEVVFLVSIETYAADQAGTEKETSKDKDELQINITTNAKLIACKETNVEDQQFDETVKTDEVVAAADQQEDVPTETAQHTGMPTHVDDQV